VIATLRGTVARVSADAVVIDVGGVGYLVNVPSRVVAGVLPGAQLHLNTHTYVREDILALYGFPTVEDLEFFELLMSVKGVGPRVALAILSEADTRTLKKAVFQEDKALLATVPGIGPKTAARLILELRDKLKAEYLAGDGAAPAPAAEPARGGVVEGAVRALTSLGYREGEVRRVIAELELGPDATLEAAVAQALKALDRQPV